MVNTVVFPLNILRLIDFVAVSLHMNIEIGLDTGIVVIVPIMEESANSNSPSRWKCVLIDENKRNDVMCQNGTHIIRWSVCIQTKVMWNQSKSNFMTSRKLTAKSSFS